MRLLPLLMLIISVSACSDSGSLEQRRLLTIERMQYTGATPDDQRVQKLILTALQLADAQSLNSPQLINIKMRIFHDDSNRGSLGVDWISSEPFATGIRVQFSDGTTSDIHFDRVELDYNNNEAKSLILFAGNPFVEREYPKTWEHLLSDQEARIVLIAQNKPISNPSPIHRVDFPDG